MATARPRRAYSGSREYFEIDGDVVKLVNQTVQRVVKLDDFLAMASSQGVGLSTPILPNGCRYYNKRGNITTFVVERPPQVKNVLWTGMHRDPARNRWKLAFPFTVFVIKFVDDAIDSSACRLFYNTAPIQSTNDIVKRSNLCNVGRDGLICTGEMRVTGENITQKAENFVAMFWQAPFNSDLAAYNFQPLATIIPEVATLEKWQEETAANSLFPLTIKWPDSHRVSDIVALRA